MFFKGIGFLNTKSEVLCSSMTLEKRRQMSTAGISRTEQLTRNYLDDKPNCREKPLYL